jgi:hypothetical protein
MTNKANIIILLLLILLFLISGLFLYNMIFSKYSDNKSFQQRIDTLYIETPGKEILIEKIPAKIIYDSNEPQQKFTALADTVSGNDTISISYSFPENNFSIKIRQGMDSIMLQRIFTEYQTIAPEPWWENPLYLLVGFLLGMIVGLMA